MSGVRVGPHAKVRHAIIGEGVVIPEGARIGCDSIEDRRRFHVTENGVVVVHGPDAARIGIAAQSAPVGDRAFATATGVFESSTRKERRGAARDSGGTDQRVHPEEESVTERCSHGPMGSRKVSDSIDRDDLTLIRPILDALH